MTQTRQFSVGVILTILTGRILIPNGIDELHDLIEHLAGQPVWHHQWGRVIDQARPHIAEAHPDLATITIPTTVTDEPSGRAFLWVIGKEHGTTRQVHPLPPRTITRIDPITEYQQMKKELDQ